MELTETIESINRQLVDLYGMDTITGRAIWRVVWSQDQFEKRLMDTTDSGLQLLYPEVRLVPKYRQWIVEKYVLERLVLVPDINSDELPTIKQSYEPLFVFEDKNSNYLPPKIQACKFVIDSVYAAMGKSSLAKYKDPESNPEEAREIKEKRINKLVEDIFGNETDVTDALSRQAGVVISNTDMKES
jgi:hypothetical protein